VVEEKRMTGIKQDPGSPCGEVKSHYSIVVHRKTTRKQNPRDYRVMLHNDNFNRREYVVQVLLKIIAGLTVDDAVNVMNVRPHAPSPAVWLPSPI
jgi:hypothetical protein